MKRLSRILFNTCTALGLVVALPVLALWVRGYIVADRVEWVGRRNTGQSVGTRVEFVNAAGGMHFEIHRFTVNSPAIPAARDVYEFRNATPGLVWSREVPWGHRSTFFDLFWNHDHGVRGDPRLN